MSSSEYSTSYERLYARPLDRAAAHAADWLRSVADRPVRPSATAADLLRVLGGELPDGPTDPADVVDDLVAGVEPGLMAMPSGRFFGWVIGGTLPAALAADWLVSAWDQNTGMRYATPGRSPPRRRPPVGCWTCSACRPDADVGFVTGATMANFTGLAAGRQPCWTATAGTSSERGLSGAPRVRVLVGAERHGPSTWRCATSAWARRPGRRPTSRAGSGRTRWPRHWRDGERADDRLPAGRQPALRRVRPVRRVPSTVAHRARRLGPRRRRVRAVGGGRRRRSARCWPAAQAADSWATDAHKTLNVPVRLRDRGRRATRRPCGPRSGMHARATSYTTPAVPAIRWRRCPSCPAAPAACRCGPRCARSAGPASPTWSTDSPGTPRARRPASPRHRRRRGAQRRRVHPGVRRIRRRRADPGGGRPAARRRHGLDVRLALARPRGAAGLGEQLVDRRRGRRRSVDAVRTAAS